MVAGLDVRDSRPDLLDDARALVAEDGGQQSRVDVLDDVESEWQAARRHPDRNLPVFGASSSTSSTTSGSLNS